MRPGIWWVLRGSNPRHSPCKGDALPTELSTQRPLVYTILENFASPEFWNFCRFDLDGLPCTGVTSGTRCPFPHVKRPKPDQRNLSALLERRLNGADRSLQSPSRSRFRNICRLSHLFDQFTFVHLEYPLLLVRNNNRPLHPARDVSPQDASPFIRGNAPSVNHFSASCYKFNA